MRNLTLPAIAVNITREEVQATEVTQVTSLLVSF